MFNQTSTISDNPMDPNWGGASFTNQAIQSGKYNEDIVKLKVA